MRQGKLRLTLVSHINSARFRLGLILGLVLLVYAPSLGGDFLGYDDDWMIEKNAFFQSPPDHAWWSIWCDLSKNTRLLLGAEYLPVRDSTVLLDIWSFGPVPQLMRAVNLVWYLVATFFCTVALRRVLGASPHVDWLAAFFALHPVHAESVAWIIGRKDVVGLAFFWAAVWFHFGQHRRRIIIGTGLLVMAQLSKFLFVTAPVLLWALGALRSDVSSKKSQVLRILLPTVACLLVALLQLHVASRTTMAGHSPLPTLHRLYTMGPVWWGYIKSSALGLDLSIMHDTVPYDRPTWQVLLGYSSILVLTLVMGLATMRTKVRSYWVAWTCFFVPLIPVSQVLVPIQNFHADRYLLLSVLGVGLAALPAIERVAADPRSGWRGLKGVTWLIVGCFAAQTAYRAQLFSHPVRLFQAAVETSTYSARAPYQLGSVYESQGDLLSAMTAYHEALSRPDTLSDAPRRATNNLARVYVKQHNYAQAELVLKRGLRMWPDDPKILGNLAEVVWLAGRTLEARARYEELVRRYPNYQQGRINYQRHFLDANSLEHREP